MDTTELTPRILAVDDSPANLVALQAVLGRGYELLCADSGPAANVDVILMDIQMPGMDGYAATTRIKSMPQCADIPIVFVTAVYNEDPHIKRGYEVGAVDYFTKPFDPDILRKKVDIYSLLKIRERQLRESEDVLRAGRKLASVLEGLPVGVIIADVEGRISSALAVSTARSWRGHRHPGRDRTKALRGRFRAARRAPRLARSSARGRAALLKERRHSRWAARKFRKRQTRSRCAR